MEDLAPNSSISTVVDRGEVHFAVSGLWTIEHMDSFLRGLTKAAVPIVERRLPIQVFGDMTGFVAQTRGTGEAIRDHLMMSQQYGLQRVAIMGASSLVKMQYKRLSNGIKVEFFDNKVEALGWLHEAKSANV